MSGFIYHIGLGVIGSGHRVAGLMATGPEERLASSSDLTLLRFIAARVGRRKCSERTRESSPTPLRGLYANELNHAQELHADKS